MPGLAATTSELSSKCGVDEGWLEKNTWKEQTHTQELFFVPTEAQTGL